jgi:N-acetylneuraminic acid mutarotase
MPAAVLDGKVYVPGGLGSLGRTLDAFEVYDPAIDSWDSLAPLPLGVHHAGIAAAAGRVYLMGGYTDLSFSTDNAQVWAYDPDDDTWERVGDMPSPRAAHALVSLEDRIYVVGGLGPEAQALWCYDPVANLWDVDLAPMPTAREHLTAVTTGGLIYVIAGRWAGQGNLGTLEIYDPETNAWRQGVDLPTARSGLTAAVVDGRIHVGRN